MVGHLTSPFRAVSITFPSLFHQFSIDFGLLKDCDALQGLHPHDLKHGAGREDAQALQEAVEGHAMPRGISVESLSYSKPVAEAKNASTAALSKGKSMKKRRSSTDCKPKTTEDHGFSSIFHRFSTSKSRSLSRRRPPVPSPTSPHPRPSSGVVPTPLCRRSSSP